MNFRKITTLLTALLLTSGGLLLTSKKQDKKEVNALETLSFEETIESIETNFHKNSSSNFDYIGQFKITFTFKEEIFSDADIPSPNRYNNDHLKYIKDENNELIDVGKGVEINGTLFETWCDGAHSPSGYYSGTNGVLDFPMKNGGVFSPVIMEFYNESSKTKIGFWFNLMCFEMDNISITFKADYFKAYNSATDKKYTLIEDLTYYTTLKDVASSDINSQIDVVQERNEVNMVVSSSTSRSTLTNAGGHEYYVYTLNTNMPLNADFVSWRVTTDHYRYLYDNIELNGKTLAYYNALSRLEKRDFTNWQDNTTLTAEYETEHATGSKDSKFDLAIQLKVEIDKANYQFKVVIPKQLFTDNSITNPELKLRDKASFHTKDRAGNALIGRINSSLKTDLDLAKNNVLDALDQYEVNLNLYRQIEKEEIETILNEARIEIENVIFISDLNVLMDDVNTSIGSKKTAAEYLKEEHVDNVNNLIDAIPSEITFTSLCQTAIQNAINAYIALTSEEKALVSNAKVQAMYEAFDAYNTLDLANYRQVAKDEIALTIKANRYFEEEKAQIEALITLAKDDIDEALSKEIVDQIVETLYTSVAPFKDAKTLANEELDAYDLTVFNAEQKTKAESIIENAKLQIAQCDLGSDIKKVLDRAKTMLNALKQTDSEVDVENLTITNTTSNKGVNTSVVIIIAVATFVGGASIAFVSTFLVFKMKGKKAK